MKTIQSILALLFFLVSCVTGTDFGSSLTIFTRAYEAASYGDFHVRGDGLRNDVRQYVHYKAAVKNSKELMSPFNLDYMLHFAYYKTLVQETATIYDKDGKPLFVSEMNWQPTETLSPDGKKLEYQMSEQAGHIRFWIVDQKIKFDGDYVSVELQNGNTIYLDIVDGYVIVPGWIYEQKGVFVAWKAGISSVTDIQTGLAVPGGVHFKRTQASGVEGIVVCESPGLLVESTVTPAIYSSPVYETTVQTAGSLTVRVRDYWGNVPTGLYYTIVGEGKEQQYLLPATVREFRIPCLKGQTFHMKFIWFAGADGKG